MRARVSVLSRARRRSFYGVTMSFASSPDLRRWHSASLCSSSWRRVVISNSILYITIWNRSIDSVYCSSFHHTLPSYSLSLSDNA